MIVCKLCGTELDDFGPKFLTHKYQNVKCNAYIWVKEAYAEEIEKEKEESINKESPNVLDSGF